ncbi:MAG: UbiD family decarboxylase, partial [Gammaproteobacteria bacterium]
MSAVLKSTLRSSDVPIDFREHIQNLRARDLLWEIDAPITIETEAHPLVRLQFRGLKEDQRRGFLLKNVRSADGRSFGGDLAIGCLAASRKIFET